MASRDLIQHAGERLAEAAGENAKVILFGSHARGEERPDSDVDLLVVEPEVRDRFAESVRLSRLVGELGVPADVVVVSEAHASHWAQVPGTMLHDALTEGQLLVNRTP
jgi:predicted nucleotidyltransferase